MGLEGECEKKTEKIPCEQIKTGEEKKAPCRKIFDVISVRRYFKPEWN